MMPVPFLSVLRVGRRSIGAVVSETRFVHHQLQLRKVAGRSPTFLACQYSRAE